MIPQPSLEELFQIERHLEEGFVALMANAGIENVYSSRGVKIAETPRVELYVTMQETLDHVHLISSERWVWDAFTARLVVEPVTHRGDDSREQQHVVFLGKVRAACSMFRLVPRWTVLQNPMVVLRVREGQTVQTWEDAENLDHSTLSYNVVFNVHPDAWPPNLDN